MSVGLLALLDDVAAFTKIAAASLDDVTGQAMKATAKAAGAVIDDTAVTPRFVHGFSAEREIPIVLKIAKGSLRNKLLFLLPAALLLTLFAPWLIMPLLMIGGAYLCYEGAEKVFEALVPHDGAHAETATDGDLTAAELETQTVAGAVQTDFILSAEIMTIILSTLPGLPFWQQALVLAIAGVCITLAVYGVVALLVKADDIGLALARDGITPFGRALGRLLVKSVPFVMEALSIIGTAAMIWVGGGIILHGLADLGFVLPEHLIEAAAHSVGAALPALDGVLQAISVAALDGIFGLVLGLCLIPVVGAAMPIVSRVLGRQRPAGGH